MNASAFRRRILIQPSAQSVIAELEDDWHRMAVTVHHKQGVAFKVEPEMVRWPWTTCRGAIAQLTGTFTHQALADFARLGAKSQNCTHLYDLAVFAAAHADEIGPIAYDVTVTDPIDGQRHAMLTRNGRPVLRWLLTKEVFLEPKELVGKTLYTLNDWIAGLGKADQEAARILRWAAILAVGRSMEMPAGMSAMAFSGGSCFTFQPDVAREAVRRDDASRYFSQSDAAPLADRSDMFPKN